jgi:tetratricopeptide (TPR) repeat protein
VRCRALLAVFMLTAHLSVLPAGSTPSQADSQMPPLSGSASLTDNQAGRDFQAGMKALDNRLYEPACQKLNRALASLNKNNQGAGLRCHAHLALAEAYLGLDNLERARVNLEEARPECLFDAAGGGALGARYFADLTELFLAEGKKDSEARAAAERCLQTLQKSSRGGQELAQARLLRGRALLNQSYYDEAKDEFKKALPYLELNPGKDRLPYAAALEGLAVSEKNLGNEREADEIMKTALALKDDAVVLDRTPDQRGLVKFQWREGLYGSRQIIDPSYPLKYMVVGGLRVACTLVRSYKHVAVLISLANCSKQPLQLAVGRVELVKTNPGRKPLRFCDPGLIDETLEENVILDRTWRRRTLCHIQKSRRLPGYLKDGTLDADDFFGNNEWGLYGSWDTHLRDRPPVVPREQLFYDDRPKNSDEELLGFMRGNSRMRPAFIEVGGARSGVVFFLRERYEEAFVRLFIGNAELRFPFHLAPGQ